MSTPKSPRLFPALPMALPGANPRRLRICIASPEFVGVVRNGGIGTAYSTLGQTLATAGHYVTCLYLEGKKVASHDIEYWVKDFKRRGMALVPLPQTREPVLDATLHVTKAYEAFHWLKKNDHFDVVHFPEWQGSAYFAVAAKRQGLAFAQTTFCVGLHSGTDWLRMAASEHLAEVEELEKEFMERQSAAMADVVVSPSQYLINWVAERGWELPAASYVQQNIVPHSARAAVAPVSDQLQDINELVFFGRLETRKGVGLFCDALDVLPELVAKKIRNVSFLGREAGVEGVSAREYITKRSKRWPWKTEIFSDRDQPQALQFIRQKGRLAVIPSLIENSPYTICECLALGISFVASQVGGIPELIAPEDIARVCFEPKPKALAAQLSTALTQGFRPARPSVDPRANEQAWLDWHESLTSRVDQPTAVAPVSLPKVSVCVTTFNRPAFLRQALASVQALDYPNFEVILVDDGSTHPAALQALQDLESAFAERGWKIVRQQNLYLGAARNTAVRNATGEFLLFMDDDNFAEPTELSTLVKAALHTNADIVTCGMNYFPGTEPPDRKTGPKNRWLPVGGDLALGAFRNCFGDANALVRRSCFESLGGFTELHGVTHEDWEFHAKAVLAGFKLTVVPEFLFWYRVSADSMIRTTNRYQNSMRNIRPYVDALPPALSSLVLFAQGQQLRQARMAAQGLSGTAETRWTVGWRSKMEAARVLVRHKQTESAVQLLIEAITSVEGCQHPPIILEALLTVGQEMRPLDRERAVTLVKLGRDLAKAIRNESAEQAACDLLTSFSAAPKPAASPTRPPVVSIIIPTFNKLELTRQCLAKLRANTLAAPHEIILVDNNSTDGTAEFLQAEEKAGRLRVILNKENFGFARACNQGAQAAKTESLLFLNNDTQVTSGWIEALSNSARAARTGVVGAKLLYANHTIQHAGIGFINGIPDHPHRHQPANAPEVNQFRELDMVTGACLMIRRELFLQLGGFDENYRNGVEDIDLCLRVRAAGWKVVYEPKAVVFHLEGQSAGRFDHVADNLKIFFERWGKSFDSQQRFIVPKPAKVIASKSSLLLPAGSITVNPDKPLAVAWEGTFLDRGSLSHVNRELTKSLAGHLGLELSRVRRLAPTVTAGSCPEFQELARTLKPIAPKEAQITIRHQWPPDWSRPKRGALVIIQPWEFGALPQDWVKASAEVDEFWVPSNYVRQVYVDSGVASNKVFVVPNGVDAERYREDVAPMVLPTRKKFRFLFVGGTIHRKGADLLVQAYLKTFTAADDVCLVIKDFGGKTFYAGQTIGDQIKAAQTRPDAPEILYLTDEFPAEAMPGLYAACQCLAHPYRGEGFGLPILEAMACGLPVIVTGGGASDDFASDEYAYRIPSRRKDIGSQISGMKLTQSGWLLEPDVTALAAQMKWVVNHREEAQRKGHAASGHARQNWTWQRAADIAWGRLQKMRLPKPSATQPITLKLPETAKIAHLGEARQLLARKNLTGAWQSTLTALGQRPFHCEAWMLLAEIARTGGDMDRARACASRARGLTPNWQPAKQLIKSLPLRAGQSVSWPPAPEIPPTPRLTVCLITKNEEAFLEQCLQSVCDIATQIVVVDTGSTDRTVEIAKKFKAEVHFLDWNDDFSAARNEALKYAMGDWVLSLDADEELLPEHRRTIVEEMQSAEVMGYRLPIIDKGREQEGCSYVPRLFRNAPGLFYVGRVHEQIFSSIEVRAREWGLENRLGRSALLHHGYRPEVVASRDKVARNLRLLRMAMEELPGEPNLVMNLGLELIRSGQLDAGLEQYREALRLMSALPKAQIVPELRETLLTQLTSHLLKAKRFNEIVQLWQMPFAQSAPMTASQHFVLGLAEMELQHPAPAAEQMRQCLAKRNAPALSPVNKEILGAAPQHCLALCFSALNQKTEAEQAFGEALTQDPKSRSVRFDFAKFQWQQRRPVEALKQLNELVAENPADLAAWQMGGQIALSQPDYLEFAQNWTSEAVKHNSEDPIITLQRAEALTLAQQAEAALVLWRKVQPVQSAKHHAAIVLGEFLTGTEPSTIAPVNEKAVSQEFLKWYRQLIKFSAHSTVHQINDALDTLRPTLPTASEILTTALKRADETVTA